MWSYAPAHNPVLARLRVLTALFADLRAEPHEDTPTASHAVMFTNRVATTPAEQQADNFALCHIANAHMKGRQQVRLHAYPHSQLSYNPTAQQEGMRT
jgi:hypothetical protein